MTTPITLAIEIKKWLADPARKIEAGLAFFNQYATPKLKENYSAFLNDSAKPISVRMPMLINKLVQVQQYIKANPQAVIAQYAQVDKMVQNLQSVNQEKQKLESELLNLKQSQEADTAKIDEIQAQLSDSIYQIEQLAEKVKEKGVKIYIGEKQLPSHLRPTYKRIKELLPLMASLHSDLQNTDLTDSQRMEIAAEICRLDDQRKKLWAEIDEFMQPTIAETETENETAQINDTDKIHHRLSRLEENIKRAEKSIKDHTTNGKKDFADKAKLRLAKYQAEYKELIK